ncbi:hypothetical protein DFH09DRAFT_1089362 [Mycena vulgaris]|nr:hypothetical protein DFH09DRAFT_1089362 [Mycena vulgaris]
MYIGFIRYNGAVLLSQLRSGLLPLAEYSKRLGRHGQSRSAPPHFISIRQAKLRRQLPTFADSLGLICIWNEDWGHQGVVSEGLQPYRMHQGFCVNAGVVRLVVKQLQRSSQDPSARRRIHRNILLIPFDPERIHAPIYRRDAWTISPHHPRRLFANAPARPILASSCYPPIYRPFGCGALLDGDGEDTMGTLICDSRTTARRTGDAGPVGGARSLCTGADQLRCPDSAAARADVRVPAKSLR